MVVVVVVGLVVVLVSFVLSLALLALFVFRLLLVIGMLLAKVAGRQLAASADFVYIRRFALQPSKSKTEG